MGLIIDRVVLPLVLRIHTWTCNFTSSHQIASMCKGVR